MEDILADKWELSSWFINREALKAARKAARSFVRIRRSDENRRSKKNKFQKNYSKKSESSAARKVREVS